MIILSLSSTHWPDHFWDFSNNYPKNRIEWQSNTSELELLLLPRLLSTCIFYWFGTSMAVSDWFVPHVQEILLSERPVKSFADNRHVRFVIRAKLMGSQCWWIIKLQTLGQRDVEQNKFYLQRIRWFNTLFGKSKCFPKLFFNSHHICCPLKSWCFCETE